MGGILAGIRRHAFVIGASASHVVVRAIGVWGRPARTFPDTIGYETLSLYGSNARFWSVPLVYQLATSQGARVAAQVAIGAAAWSALAVVLSLLTRYPRTITVATLVLGLTPQAARYDLAILSESLGISFTVAAIASTIAVVTRPTRASTAWWVVTVVLSSFVRPTHLVVVWVATLVVAATYLVRRSDLLVVPLSLLILASAWGVNLAAGNGPTSTLNMYTVLAERVLPDDHRWEWFLDAGMPGTVEMRTAGTFEDATEVPADVAAIVDLPPGQRAPKLMRAGGTALARWVTTDGWSVYGRYVVTHPADTWARFRWKTPLVLDPADDEFLPLQYRTLVPRGLFEGWLVWLAALGVAVVSTWRRHRRRLAAVLIAMSATGGAVFALGLLMSGIEHPRHAATSAVVLRVLALCAAAASTCPVSAMASQTETAGASESDPANGDR